MLDYSTSECKRVYYFRTITDPSVIVGQQQSIKEPSGPNVIAISIFMGDVVVEEKFRTPTIQNRSEHEQLQRLQNGSET
jgi:hypothetical protein